MLHPQKAHAVQDTLSRVRGKLITVGAALNQDDYADQRVPGSPLLNLGRGRLRSRTSMNMVVTGTACWPSRRTRVPC